MTTCPTCGAKHQRGFQFTAPTIQSKRPVWRWSERGEAALLIPLGQALGTGAIVAAAGALATDLWMPGWEPAKVGALCGVVALGGVWWDGIRDDAKRVWYELERRFGVDLDGDGVVGEPEQKQPDPPPPPDAWVGQSRPGRRQAHWKLHKIPFADYYEAQRVARAVLARGAPFTRRGLEEAGAIPKDPGYHSRIYNAMLDAKLAKKSGNGAVLTEAGREYLAGCLAPPPRA